MVLLGSLAVLRLRAFHNQRHILVLTTDSLQEFNAGMRVFLLRVLLADSVWLAGLDIMYREPNVADNAEAIVLVLLIDSPCLFVRTG